MPALIKADGGALACPRVVTIDKTADPGTVVHSVMAYDEVGRDGVARIRIGTPLKRYEVTVAHDEVGRDDVARIRIGPRKHDGTSPPPSRTSHTARTRRTATAAARGRRCAGSGPRSVSIDVSRKDCVS